MNFKGVIIRTKRVVLDAGCIAGWLHSTFAVAGRTPTRSSGCPENLANKMGISLRTASCGFVAMSGSRR
jgi:hypothetical protein